MVQIKVLADLRDCAIQPVVAASTFLFILIAHSLKNGRDPRRIGLYLMRRQGHIARAQPEPSSRIRLNQAEQLLPGLDARISKADGWQP